MNLDTYRLLRWTNRFLLGVSFLLLAVLLALPIGCGTNNDEKHNGKDIPVILPREVFKPPSVRFVDITAKAGIDFLHTNGSFGKKLLPETMGSGVAFLDFDKDGKQDLLFVNGCYWPGHEDKSRKPPTLALYRNKGDGTGAALFENVTAKCGLEVTMYGMGVTVGDYDNDGWPDVFISGVGGNRLFHNEEDGQGGRRFVDVTGRAGDLANSTTPWPMGTSGMGTSGLRLDARHDARHDGRHDARHADFLERDEPMLFPSSAAFFDYDNDGLLDLFVCNYVHWSPKFDLSQKCQLQGDTPAYCPPKVFPGTQCFLYRNLGKGKFEDVSKKAGIHVTGELGEAVGKSLGVIVCDLDEDGWQDIIVANDTTRNFLFHNKGNGRFEELGQDAGVAFAQGETRGAMGIDYGEYRSGRFAVVIGNFANEPNTLLRRERTKPLRFTDVALIEGLWGPARIVLKFGLFFFDFDLDGLLDLLSCNGHLEPDIHLIQSSQSFKQPVQLYWHTGGKRAYELVTKAEAGPDLFTPLVGRGCAFADIDGNGTLDVVLTENGGPARLFRNEGLKGNHWVRLLLEGDPKQKVNRDAIGATVTLTAAGNTQVKTQVRHVTSARSYQSQCEFPITFGLGKADKVDRVEVRWPGRRQSVVVLENLKVDQQYQVKQK